MALLEKHLRLQENLAQSLRMNAVVEQLALKVVGQVRIYALGIDLNRCLDFVGAFFRDQHETIAQREHLLDRSAIVGIVQLKRAAPVSHRHEWSVGLCIATIHLRRLCPAERSCHLNTPIVGAVGATVAFIRSAAKR